MSESSESESRLELESFLDSDSDVDVFDPDCESSDSPWGYHHRPYDSEEEGLGERTSFSDDEDAEAFRGVTRNHWNNYILPLKNGCISFFSYL